MRSRKKVAAAIIIIAAGVFFAGWFIGRATENPAAGKATLAAIHQNGFNLANPLLTCTNDSSTPIDAGMQSVLQNTIANEEKNGDVITASVYYRSFANGSWASVNGAEKYYPASLNKVPLMMAYYTWMEENGTQPTAQLFMPAGLNENAQQEVPPVHPLEPGHSYSVEQLIDAMIEDSDNNATLVLLNNIDQNIFAQVFKDLNVPYLAPGEQPTNYMTVSDYAFLFRVLYNGTYLAHSDSEHALDIMTQSTFKDGLAAGLPAGTTVAHKFGLVSVAPNNAEVTARELHDCGIVYPATKSPYLLCVMTKSTSTLQNAEQSIADISKAAYQYITQ